MTPDQLEEAARTICAARREGSTLDGLGDLTPQTTEEGYAVQDAFMRAWDEPVAGWKVAATAPEVQEVYGVTGPFCGPFYAPTTFTSPARPKAGNFGHLCVESEFAFRFGAPLPARKEGYAREEMLDAIDVLIPAFELISPRFNTLLQDRVALATADCALNGGFVLGAPIARWRTLDLAAEKVVFTVDGDVKGEGTGANVLGHPFNALDWLVNALSQRGIDLNAGEVVSTGTCTGFVYIEAGQRAVADFGEIGQVEVTFV